MLVPTAAMVAVSIALTGLVVQCSTWCPALSGRTWHTGSCTAHLLGVRSAADLVALQRRVGEGEEQFIGTSVR